MDLSTTGTTGITNACRVRVRRAKSVWNHVYVWVISCFAVGRSDVYDGYGSRVGNLSECYLQPAVWN